MYFLDKVLHNLEDLDFSGFISARMRGGLSNEEECRIHPLSNINIIKPRPMLWKREENKIRVDIQWMTNKPPL